MYHFEVTFKQGKLCLNKCNLDLAQGRKYVALSRDQTPSVLIDITRQAC